LFGSTRFGDISCSSQNFAGTICSIAAFGNDPLPVHAAITTARTSAAMYRTGIVFDDVDRLLVHAVADLAASSAPHSPDFNLIEQLFAKNSRRSYEMPRSAPWRNSGIESPPCSKPSPRTNAPTTSEMLDMPRTEWNIL
jgi:hypothetical protein